MIMCLSRKLMIFYWNIFYNWHCYWLLWCFWRCLIYFFYLYYFYRFYYYGHFWHWVLYRFLRWGINYFLDLIYIELASFADFFACIGVIFITLLSLYHFFSIFHVQIEVTLLISTFFLLNFLFFTHSFYWLLICCLMMFFIWAAALIIELFVSFIDIFTMLQFFLFQDLISWNSIFQLNPFFMLFTFEGLLLSIDRWHFLTSCSYLLVLISKIKPNT